MSETKRADRHARPRGCLRFGLRTLLLIPLMIGGLLAGIYAWPKSAVLPVNHHYIGHYRGLGLTGEPGFFGRNYFHFTIDYRPSNPKANFWEVEFNQEGYNAFRQYYANGQLAEEGECLVEVYNLNDPLPLFDDVRWSKCYKPDGSLGSEVKDGTGVQTGWYPNGHKSWELELRDYKRDHLRMWYENGQLSVSNDYVERDDNGSFGGPYQSYFQDGTPKTKGEYFDDRFIVTRYDETGAVVSIEDYSTSPPTITKPKPPTAAQAAQRSDSQGERERLSERAKK